MAKEITLNINSRTYHFPMPPAGEERRMRIAAEKVNSVTEAFLKASSNKNDVDVMTMVALNIAVGNVALEDENNDLKKEIESLDDGLKTYLDKV